MSKYRQKKLNVRIYDIEWDTEEGVQPAPLSELDRLISQEAALPTETFVPLNFVDFACEDSLHDAILDYLSDTYGYCVLGFQISRKDVEAFA